MKTRVLIVEDDEMVQSLLAAFLENEGFAVSCALTGGEMFAVLSRETVHLILLDLMLPDEDGLVLARQVRARSTVPIIVLTARRGRDDRLAALDIGADDYMTKPFDPRELVLRIRNLLGRAGGDALEVSVLGFEGWVLDVAGRSLSAPDGRDVALTPGEFNLLAALAKASNRVLSRGFLLDAISQDEDVPSDRMIDVYVSRLRRKIEKTPGKPRLIVTIPGHGYKLAATTS
jgi:two-component system, OmpR family, response regulator